MNSVSENTDMVPLVANRDEFYKSAFDPEIASFPQHPEQDYQSVFVEPAVYKDNKCGRTCAPLSEKLFGNIFKYTQAGFYYFLVFLLGFFLSFIWAILFAIANYTIVWILQPAIKIIFLYLRVSASLFRASIRSLFDPLFESWGQMFSFIRGKFGLTLKSDKADFIVDAI